MKKILDVTCGMRGMWFNKNHCVKILKNLAVSLGVTVDELIKD